MNYSETSSILLSKSSDIEKQNETSNKLFKSTTLAIAFAVLLIAVVFSYSRNDNQYTGQSSLPTAELNCNNHANRTSYALGCKPNNDLEGILLIF